MNYNRLFLILGFLIIQSCIETNNNKELNIDDFINNEEKYLTDTSKYISFDSFIKEYDTIPNEFGYKIFNDIISRIPTDSSEFKKIWNWEIEKIENVIARKSNIRLDSKKILSDETYFFVINILTKNNLKINSTIYIDFKKQKIGSYSIPLDSLKFIELKNDYYNFDNKILETIKHSP